MGAEDTTLCRQTARAISTSLIHHLSETPGCSPDDFVAISMDNAAANVAAMPFINATAGCERKIRSPQIEDTVRRMTPFSPLPFPRHRVHEMPVALNKSDHPQASGC